ncbi:mitochondrial import inner membrane translocase subunit TIM8 [Fimicolochytrium jonesii]|uniref:mitochondrial import inner membrane translocase subunit TIM8 n=1 Tax=Fimicolochytrium jonesii TaxID=1396493 RepID=UPI0022FE9FF1|nr:mitochondrial import inner membrane translocase subunit TIM8 [Fimicolochytrium jonesii]KAI8823383.1 mitochondrial import inner membrane translocase subunit TIM8 [Fimicolochytrium jonesii]
MASLPTGLNLDEKSKAELMTFVENEQRRANFQATVHQYTDTCWDKCITKVKATTDKSDEVCLTNCVDRFLDSTILLLNSLGAQQQR